MGRTALVTGASRGIGLAVAQRLARDGWAVVNLSRTAPETFPGTTYRCDLADAEATRAVLAEVVARHEISALVNNAGVIRVGAVERVEVADFDRMVAVNLRALLLCTQAVVPGMRARGFGRIVNIGSRAALGKEGRSVYSATKAGVLGFTRSWALELARDGITVNAIAPGPIETELFRDSNPADSPQTKALIAQVPVGRIGTPEDVAAAASYFLSEEAGFVTGQSLNVCGGLSVGQAAL
ncbi:MAG TPA: SDR family oxidoreductase [Beijerinckiaceae bacterium]|nr:SDR family oxidoreductase [Beijerinckiaceae bacterium]